MQEQDGIGELQRPAWFICEPVYLQVVDETYQERSRSLIQSLKVNNLISTELIIIHKYRAGKAVT